MCELFYMKYLLASCSTLRAVELPGALPSFFFSLNFFSGEVFIFSCVLGMLLRFNFHRCLTEGLVKFTVLLYSSFCYSYIDDLWFFISLLPVASNFILGVEL